MCVVLLLLDDFFDVSISVALKHSLCTSLSTLVACNPWSSASCVGCRRLRLVGHSMPVDRIGVLLVSSVSSAFLFVCCGMAVCHFHSLLPLPTFHKSIRFAFASAGLLLSVCVPRCEKRSVVSVDMTCDIDMTCDVVAPVSVCVCRVGE